MDIAQLDSALAGSAVAPGASDWDSARMAWNLAVDQHPAGVVFAQSAGDVQAAVRFARDQGLRVAAQATGHAASLHPTLADTLLVKTSRMAAVEVDPEARVARIGAGVLSADAAAAAARHGLTPLLGSSVDVGVVGFTVGGGLGWLARAHGLACNSVRSAEVVTAAGELVRADASSQPELFWALRGGGGSFGIVTALEVELYELAEVFAGDVMYDAEHAPQILRAYRDWARTAPADVTTSVRFLTPPPLPEVPEPVRGRPLVTVTGAYAGPAAAGEELLAPMRDLAPVIMDSYAAQPAEGVLRIHGDPEQPVPGFGRGMNVHELDDGAIDALVGVAGIGSDSPLLQVDLRHLGAAVGTRRPGAGALAALGGEFTVSAVAVPMGPVTPEAANAGLDRLAQTLEPWGEGLGFLNFSDQPGTGEALFAEGDYARLRAAKAAYDPDSLIRGGHEIAPA